MLKNILTNIDFFDLYYSFVLGFILLVSPLFCYFNTNIYKHILFSKISIYIRILFLILYILLYILTTKKHKKYVLISFIILWLCFAFFISPKYAI